MLHPRFHRATTAVAMVFALVLTSFAFAQHGILDDPARPAEERERDSGSKPLEVYAFFGVEAGMTVVDLMPGGGYNTHLLSKIVGDGGTLYAGPDRRGRLAERAAEAGWSNVTMIASADEVPAGSVDVIVTVRNLHDLESRGDTVPIYSTYLQALKPGGIFGVVDARTPKEGFDDGTHRINQQVIVDNVTAAGFELVAESDLLANPEDDFGKYEGLGNRYDIDRMVLKFRRPAN